MAIFGSIFNIFILFFTLTKLSLCLYEDQIGKFDWKQSYIGKIKFGTFDSVKRIVVATEENVVAALNLKNGQIIWRQVLESPLTSSIYLLHVDREVMIVSGDGNTFLIRGWDLNSGVLLWDWSLHTEKTNAEWVVKDGQLIHLVPVVGSHLEVTEYEVQSGRNRGATSKISTPWVTNLLQCTLADIYWTCLSGDDSNSQIYYLDIVKEPSKFYTKPLSSLIGNVAGKIRIKNFKYTQPAILLEYNSVFRLVILEENSPQVLPQTLPANAITMTNGDKNVFVSLETKDNSLKITTVETEGEEDVSVVETEYPPSLGLPKAISGICRGSACRLLFATSDDALCLLQIPTGKILWTREEALSNVVGVEFIELPVSDLDASIEKEFTSTTTTSDVFSMLYRRLLSQTRQLSSLVTGKQATADGLVRDEFGLHKLIIIATKVGKLFAIDTVTGEIIWAKNLPKITPFIALNKPKILLFEQRNSRYPPLLASCVLLARDSETGNGVLFRFDPITGRSESGLERLNFRIKQAMLLPYEDESRLKGLVILSEDNQIYVYPSSIKNVLNQHADSTFLFSIETNASIVQGYKFTNALDLVAKATWKIDLSPAKIIAASVRPSNERVHSQGRVLADRSVLYKYVNPNLVALVTISDDPLHKHVLSMYLIDGVTGLVVYSTNHKRCKGPVHLVHSENWIVYSYFSERFRRIEITAVELYEGASQSNSTAFSSHAVSQLPHVETLAYILPANPLHMVATLTERGITSKHLLIALSNGAVIELPWMFLEPRGPHIFSGPDEGSIPYMPELPLMSEATINYNQSLSRVAGIHVSPARLESTTLVLVNGLDLFFTRVTPSKSFDVLKEDFDHWLIVTVLVGLIVSSYITKQLASKKALRQAWK